jgi:hypothetical protein
MAIHPKISITELEMSIKHKPGFEDVKEHDCKMAASRWTAILRMNYRGKKRHSQYIIYIYIWVCLLPTQSVISKWLRTDCKPVSCMHEQKAHCLRKKNTHNAAAYRIKVKRLVSWYITSNPLTGSKELWVTIEHKNSGIKTILLTTSEVDSCVEEYYNKYKGSGVRKLYRVICSVFTGVTHRDI